MKVRAAIGLIEEHGWFFLQRVAATVNSNTLTNPAVSLLPESRPMTLRRAHSIVF